MNIKTNLTDRHVKIVQRILTRLKIKQLRLLVAIAKHNSILHASEEISISQPAATKLLKDLESDFNVLLFDRTNRGVIPTQFGEVLVKHGKLVLAQISTAAQELDDLSEGLGGRIVVGTLLAASAQVLPRAIIFLREQRPKVSIVVRDGTNDFLMPLLHSGEVDMVVGRLTEFRYREELTQEILCDEKIVAVCRKSHPLAHLKSVSIDEMNQHQWILPPMETTLRRQIDSAFFDQGFTSPPHPVECISFLTNRSLLLATNMIGVFPIHVVQSEIVNGQMVILDSNLNIKQSPIGVSYRREGILSPAASKFLEMLKMAADEFQTIE
ncbi:MAG: LysR substrate-binding domain-containing protein [Gammaproteobacteria bacterium]|nr:LysR substrate-binding domain-containing protein [Gammaproteobacteria bacterium]MCY4219198.1 LysR substrate-binding domain-containing protein [Gammaproteobacteria bacterium]MCY4274537.1 LysR substrate-binding domain-containing protein [Gammaproteobacteria bacterium]